MRSQLSFLHAVEYVGWPGGACALHACEDNLFLVPLTPDELLTLTCFSHSFNIKFLNSSEDPGILGVWNLIK